MLSLMTLTRCRHLLLEIRRELQDLRRDVSEIKSILDRITCDSEISTPPIDLWDTPEEINSRFLGSIRFNAPETFQDLSDIPLKEGFDALVFHFSQVVNSIIQGTHTLTSSRAQSISIPASIPVKGRPRQLNIPTC